MFIDLFYSKYWQMFKCVVRNLWIALLLFRFGPSAEQNSADCIIYWILHLLKVTSEETNDTQEQLCFCNLPSYPTSYVTLINKEIKIMQIRQADKVQTPTLHSAVLYTVVCRLHRTFSDVIIWVGLFMFSFCSQINESSLKCFDGE